MDGIITFPPIDPNRVLQPHEDALILTLRISDFDVRRILIDQGNSVDLLQMSTYRKMGLPPSALENLGRILSGFNGASITFLGDIVLPVQIGPITQNMQFSLVKICPLSTPS